MSSEWLLTTVGEFCPFKYGKGLPERDRRAGSFGVYSSAGLVGSHDAPLVNTPGVVIGRKGTVGSISYSASPFWPIDTTFYIDDQPGLRDIRYTYYLLKTLGLHLMNTDSAVPGLNRENAHAVEVLIPPLDIQRNIATFLEQLDDRITLLRETNATLDAIAQTLFKSWFVDFEPVRAKAEDRQPEGMDATAAALFPDSFEESELGLVPKGWLTRSIYDMATYINGAAYKAFEPNAGRRGLPIIKIAELKAGITTQTAFSDVVMPAKYLIETGDILFSWSGNPDTSIDTFVWQHAPALLNQHIFRVLPHESFERSFVLQMLRNLKPVFAELARNKQTTGLGHVTVADLKRLHVVHPPQSVIEQFNTIAVPIHQMIFGNEQQAQTLTQLRDSLLPRLISGQLRLPDAEQTVAEALA